MVNDRRRRNFIKELECEDGRVVRNHVEIEEEVSSFYEKLFTEEVDNRPFLDGLDWSPLFRRRKKVCLKDPLRKRRLGELSLICKRISRLDLTVFPWSFSRIVGILSGRFDGCL